MHLLLFSLLGYCKAPIANMKQLYGLISLKFQNIHMCSKFPPSEYLERKCEEQRYEKHHRYDLTA